MYTLYTVPLIILSTLSIRMGKGTPDKHVGVKENILTLILFTYCYVPTHLFTYLATAPSTISQRAHMLPAEPLYYKICNYTHQPLRREQTRASSVRAVWHEKKSRDRFVTHRAVVYLGGHALSVSVTFVVPDGWTNSLRAPGGEFPGQSSPGEGNRQRKEPVARAAICDSNRFGNATSQGSGLRRANQWVRNSSSTVLRLR